MAPKRKAAQVAEEQNKRIAINTSKAVEVLDAQGQDQEEEERERPSYPSRSSVQSDASQAGAPSLQGKKSSPQSYGAPTRFQSSSPQPSRSMPNLPVQSSDGATRTQKIFLFKRLQEINKAGLTLPTGLRNPTSSPSQQTQTTDSIDARSKLTGSQGHRRSQSNPVPNLTHQFGSPPVPPVSCIYGDTRGTMDQMQPQQGIHLQQPVQFRQGDQNAPYEQQYMPQTQLDFQNQAAMQRQLIAQQHRQLHPIQVLQLEQMTQSQQGLQLQQSEEPRYAPNQPNRPPLNSYTRANHAGGQNSSPLLSPFEPRAPNPRSSFQVSRPRANSTTILPPILPPNRPRANTGGQHKSPNPATFNSPIARQPGSSQPRPPILPPNHPRANDSATRYHKQSPNPATHSSFVADQPDISRRVDSSGLCQPELPPNRPRTNDAGGGNSIGQSGIPVQQKNLGQSQTQPIHRIKLVVSRESLREQRGADAEASPAPVKPGSRQPEHTRSISDSDSDSDSTSGQSRNVASAQTQNVLAEGIPLPPVDLSNIDPWCLEPEEAQKRLDFGQTVHPAHLEALQKWSRQRALSHVDMEAEFGKMIVQARPENVDWFRNIGYDPLTQTLHHNPHTQFPLGIPICKKDRTPLRQEVVTQEEEARKNGPQQQQRPPLLRKDSRPLAEIYLNNLSNGQGQTEQQEEEARLREVLTKTLSQYKIARAEDEGKNSQPPQVDRRSPQASEYIVLEMLSFIGANRPGAQMFGSWNNPVRMELEDSAGCSFCQYECSFGISDSRVWLPEEAAQGFCLDCHESTMTVARAWTDYDKLPSRMEKAELDRFAQIHGNSAVSPLKELGSKVDFYKQAADQLDNPLRLKTMENFKARRKSEGRRATISGADRKSVILGNRNPQKRAVSSGLGAAKATNNSAGNINRTSKQSINGAQGRPQMGDQHESMPPLGPSPSSGLPSIPRKLHAAQATQTSWKGGVPMHNQSLILGTSSAGDQSGKLRASNGTLTPTGEEIMAIMGFSPPPKSTDKTALRLPDTAKAGPPRASFAPRNASIADTSSQAQPSRPIGPSSIPQRPLPARPLAGIDYSHSEPLPPPSYNSDMNGIAPPRRPIRLQKPPFYKGPDSGPDFCRGSPWRQVDFTRARICPNCYHAKRLIIKHRQHTSFKLLVKVPGVASREREGFGLVRSDGNQVVCDGRYRNCMICTGQAIHGCDTCPLRVCEECEVRLRTMCKGRIENLLDFYGRTHIRNDAFLLRSDGKGF